MPPQLCASLYYVPHFHCRREVSLAVVSLAVITYVAVMLVMVTGVVVEYNKVSAWEL
jgi:hypothetical protein